LHGKKSSLLIYCQSNLFLLLVHLRKTFFSGKFIGIILNFWENIVAI